ncbi:MAG: hypothetical protein JRI75_07015 [Deltaproteobacteria bacterium]|nr:hypothetical protein [Deltaproteobacteria bacterium]
MDRGQKGNLSSTYKVTIAAGMVWTMVLIGFYVWGVRNVFKHTKALVAQAVRAFFQEIVTTRYWNATP